MRAQEYAREIVRVHPLESIVPMNSAISPNASIPASNSTASAIAPAHPEPLPSRDRLEPSIECHTYIWCRPLSELDKGLWTFDEFMQTNSWKWVGSKADGNEDYQEVERRRQMAGEIVRET